MTSADLLEWRAGGKKPRAHIEDELQRAVWQHIKLLAPKNVIAFAVPNGVPTSKRTGARFKATGTVAGVADLCIVTPDGLARFLELKKAGGRLSPDQKAFQAKCEAMSVPYVVCYSLDSALAILRAWNVITDY